MWATAMAPWSCCGGWTGGGSPDCGTAGSMAATVARSWTGHTSTGPSRSKWCSAATAGGSGFAWLGRFRRLSKDYEHLITTSEAVIYLAMTRLLVRRLTRP